MAKASPALIMGASPVASRFVAHQRRGALQALLVGAAAVAAGAPPALAASPADADMHDAVAEFRAADDAISLDNLSDADAPPALFDRWADAIEAVADLEPETLPGLAAKAQATIAALDRNVPSQTGDTVEDVAEDHVLLAYRLAHDVLTIAGAEPWPPHPAKAELFAHREAIQADRAANPPPWAEWQARAEAERARLAALGLNRPDGAGLTCGDQQLVGWLLRRIESAMGRDVAEHVRALSTIPADAFDATWHTILDHHYAAQGGVA